MLKPQQTLNSRYQLQQTLGNTAPGRQTWLAVDLETPNQEKVVIKLLAFHPETHWEDIKLFEREAQILRHLNHPQIPKYRDDFTLEPELGDGLPQLALVQNYIQGTSLEEILRQKKKLQPEKVVDIAKQVLNILVYLHELSPPVLHRDIKPSNLILGENQQIYLIDFGSVQDNAKNKNATFTIVGTQGYAPPEQLMGKAVAASDLYSLGATLVHLLTGVEPAGLPQSNCRLLWSDMAFVSDNFVRWLNQLIDPDLEVRFSTAKQALEALKNLTNNTDEKETIPTNDFPVNGLSLSGVIVSLLVLIGILSITGHNQKFKQQAIEIASCLTEVQINPRVRLVNYKENWRGEINELILQFSRQQAKSFLNSNPNVLVDEEKKIERFETGEGGRCENCLVFSTQTRRLYINSRNYEHICQQDELY